MAKTKSEKAKTKKVEKFKEGAKQAAAVAAQPRTHMVPQTEWPSNANLDLRGDLAEAFEIHLVKAYEALQAAGSVFQQFMSMNIQSGKAKVTYIWNTGEIPTEEEVTKYKEAMEYVQQQRAKQMELIRKNLEAGGETEGEGTVLQTLGGAPLTVENLEQEKGGLIITP